MNANPRAAKLRRLKFWMVVLTLAPGAAAAAAGNPPFAIGHLTGGAIIFLNLLGTELTVRSFTGGTRFRSVLAVIAYGGKLAVSAVIAGAVLVFRLASPIGLMTGISTLLAALMFDFFLFPDNKGVGKKET